VLGLDHLELQTRVELTENHATFRAMGFTETGHRASRHDRISITFRRRFADTAQTPLTPSPAPALA
jgi:hypothetical protein